MPYLDIPGCTRNGGKSLFRHHAEFGRASDPPAGQGLVETTTHVFQKDLVHLTRYLGHDIKDESQKHIRLTARGTFQFIFTSHKHRTADDVSEMLRKPRCLGASIQGRGFRVSNTALKRRRWGPLFGILPVAVPNVGNVVFRPPSSVERMIMWI